MTSPNSKVDCHPSLDISYDMGWKMQSSGNQYDSLSSQGIMFGCRTGKPVAWCVLAKECACCSKAQQIGHPPPPHDCPRNFQGSSKAMESKAARRIVVSLWISGYKVTHVVGNDDATTRAILQHKGHQKTDKGKLDRQIHLPIWWADPGHQTKVMVVPFFTLAWQPKSPIHCMRSDSYHLKPNYACAIHMYRKKSFKVFNRAMKGTLEPLFDDHKWCGDWCHLRYQSPQTLQTYVKYHDKHKEKIVSVDEKSS